MRTLTSIILLFLSAGSWLYGQSSYFALKKKLLAADSIFTISYKSKNDSLQGLEFLLKEDDFLLSSLKTKLLLNHNQKNRLITILTQGERISRRIPVTRHFKPRNAILIYKQGTLSYIDICFSCRTIETTKNIKFDNFDIKPDKWQAIEKYFNQLNLIEQ